ncbi:hypothetical protein B4123_0510 [Bacillus paralicheniformis]|nr:hypothetical protein B4123_2570 [Bacillus paralicheniformis]OLG13088.1 hypothetical protein B4123_0510 [Bacillus paralicheniformis]
MIFIQNEGTSKKGSSLAYLMKSIKFSTVQVSSFMEFNF